MQPECWLHRIHGDDPRCLQPMRLPRCEEGQSHAEAMAVVATAKAQQAAPSNHRVNHRGARCTVDTGSLLVEGCTIPLCSFFLTQASHAPLTPESAARGGQPAEFVAVAIVLPSAGADLGGLVGGQDAAGALGWLVLVQGGLLPVLESLSRAGCLRDDLEEAYQPVHGEIFGQGAYATVTRMTALDGGELVAVKNLNLTVEFESIEREIATLIAVQTHPNVVGYHGTWWSPDPETQGPRISMVFEAACGGDLLAKVLHSDPLTEAYAKALFHGMMKGIDHIHAKDIVHRDIKAQNILLMSDDTVVVADFGLATLLTDRVQMARRCGSPGYVAPEVCLGKEPYGLKVDVFGAGVNLYLMLSKEMPFSSPDRDTAATMRRTVKCSLHLRRPPWDGFSSALRGMLRETITREQEGRLSADQALQHAWLCKAPRQDGGPDAAARAPGYASVRFEEPMPPDHERPDRRPRALASPGYPQQWGQEAVGGCPQPPPRAPAEQPDGREVHRVQFGSFRK